MEYRRLGKTEQMVSVIGLGGHSRSDLSERREVVNRCLDIGINYIDSTGSGELLRDIQALGSRREAVYPCSFRDRQGAPQSGLSHRFQAAGNPR